MPWNLPEQKQKSAKTGGDRSPFWQQLNCFENGHFHAGRFAILLALLLMLIGGIKAWQSYQTERQAAAVSQGERS